MKVLDRYLGQEVDLPGSVVPGRYRLLKQANLNGDIPLNAGQLVFSDGRDHCRIGDVDGTFQDVGQSESAVAERDLLVSALTTLAQLIRQRGEQQISPLIPAKLGEVAKLADLEKVLTTTIKHLREIDRRPRVSMHYSTDVAPLSRAKRIARAAMVHLASHSEDWHRRTLSGVQPKRILAMFSEDEWVTYENRVFARLLDRIDSYLRSRVAEVKRLEEKYRDALRLGESLHLYHRLRESLCQLWGDALSVDETDRLLDTASSSLHAINDLAKKISVLRQGFLYGKIPRNALVAEQLRDTNILQHDPHYRHLRNLWLLYQKRAAEMRATPVEMYDRDRQMFEDFVLYLGMLLRRVLAECRALDADGMTTEGNFTFAGNAGHLQRDGDEWVLQYDGVLLTIVPALSPTAESVLSKPCGDQRVPIFLFSPSPTVVADSEGQFEHIIVNPLEFYGLERLRVLIQLFLWRPVFAIYGNPLRKMPMPAKQWLISKGIGTADDGDELVLLEPLSDIEMRELEDWLSSATINDDTKAGIRHQAKALQALALCRACGRRARFEARGSGFMARCGGCSLEWGLFRESGRRRARLGVSGASNPTFESHGAWSLELTV